MTKYSQYRARNEKPREKVVHPVWRGVGWGLMILTPILAYSGALVLLSENQKQGWFQIPSDLIATGSDPLLYVKALLTVTLILLLGFLFTLITFILYRMFGPARYGPYDVPPAHYRGKRYKR